MLEVRELDEPSPRELRVLHDDYALCDEEVFYRREGKVSAATWKDWERGTQLNLQRLTFRTAWTQLRDNEQLDQRFAEFEPISISSWPVITSTRTPVGSGGPPRGPGLR